MAKDSTPNQIAPESAPRRAVMTTCIAQYPFVREDLPLCGQRAILCFAYRGKVCIPRQIILDNIVREVIVVASDLFTKDDRALIMLRLSSGSSFGRFKLTVPLSFGLQTPPIHTADMTIAEAIRAV